MLDSFQLHGGVNCFADINIHAASLPRPHFNFTLIAISDRQETSADEKMLWFEATQTAEEVRHAALIEEAGADVLAGWLAEEPEEVIFNVDFGDFGRPVTAQGIEEWYDAFAV